MAQLDPDTSHSNDNRPATPFSGQQNYAEYDWSLQNHPALERSPELGVFGLRCALQPAGLVYPETYQLTVLYAALKQLPMSLRFHQIGTLTYQLLRGKPVDSCNRHYNSYDHHCSPNCMGRYVGALGEQYMHNSPLSGLVPLTLSGFSSITYPLQFADNLPGTVTAHLCATAVVQATVRIQFSSFIFSLTRLFPQVRNSSYTRHPMFSKL